MTIVPLSADAEVIVNVSPSISVALAVRSIFNSASSLTLPVELATVVWSLMAITTTSNEDVVVDVPLVMV